MLDGMLQSVEAGTDLNNSEDEKGEGNPDDDDEDSGEDNLFALYDNL